MKIVVVTVLMVTLLSIQGLGQRVKPGSEREKTMLTTNECVAKGGIGIVTTSIYINSKGTKNELLLSTGKKWTGQPAGRPEIAVFFDSRIWSPQVLPDKFVSKAIVVSFEGNIVRFIDFSTMTGGYYRRSGGD